MTETLQQKTERNFRVQSRYDELIREGKHGHYETMFRVVREEVERVSACAQCALLPTIETASNSLIAAMIGSCTCITKTPETEYHSADCRYRKMASALDDLDTIRTAVTSTSIQGIEKTEGGAS